MDINITNNRLRSTGGFKRRIVEIFLRTPLDSECSISDSLYQLNDIMVEYEVDIKTKIKIELQKRIKFCDDMLSNNPNSVCELLKSELEEILNKLWETKQFTDMVILKAYYGIGNGEIVFYELLKNQT